MPYTTIWPRVSALFASIVIVRFIDQSRCILNSLPGDESALVSVHRRLRRRDCSPLLFRPTRFGIDRYRHCKRKLIWPYLA